MHRCALSAGLLALGLPLLAAAGPPDLPVTRAQPDHATASSTACMKRFVSSRLQDALQRHAARVSRRSQGRKSFDQARFVERFSRRLLREGGRIDGRLLPQSLPLLPLTGDTGVQQVIDGGKAHTRTAKQLYLYLERQTGRLRGSSDPQQQQLAARLCDYLAGYKDSWAEPWIASRLQAFGRSPTRLEITYQPGLTTEQRRNVQQRVRAAQRVLRRAVHPALLRRVSSVKLEAGTSFSVPGIVKDSDGKRHITLRPDSSIKDVLHEYGHMVGFRGGLRPLATAHAILSRRAHGTAPEPLSTLIPGTTYGPAHTGYRGGFVQPYVGRRYNDGFTEVLSMGLEHLESPQRAAQLFRQDGEYFLLMLKALQQPPPTTTRRQGP